jgi:hypothetical protein
MFSTLSAAFGLGEQLYSNTKAIIISASSRSYITQLSNLPVCQGLFYLTDARHQRPLR